MKLLLVSEGPNELDGALQTLVERLREQSFQVECDRVSRGDIRAVHGKGKGYFKRAVRWLLEAERRGYDALVLVIDHDGDKERPKQIGDAQDYAGTAIRRALGVAIRTFDAWMLADDVALSQALATTVRRQRAPESNRDPKQTIRELCNQIRQERGLGVLYASVARILDMATLEQRCPRGFAPFADRVRAM